MAVGANDADTALLAQLAVPNKEPVIPAPTTFNDPVILTLPVNWCVLDIKVPKRVEPVTKSVLEVITCATIV